MSVFRIADRDGGGTLDREVTYGVVILLMVRVRLRALARRMALVHWIGS